MKKQHLNLLPLNRLFFLMEDLTRKEAQENNKMEKYKYSTPFGVCPYCGKEDVPCSDITSLTRAFARSFCKKIHGGVTIQDLSQPISADLEKEL